MQIDYKILKKKLEKNFDVEHRLEQVAWVRQTLEKYKHLNPKNPEDFSIIASKEIFEPLDSLFRHATFGKMEAKRFYLLEFVFVHYDFVSHHIERFLEQIEGTEHCEEKTRWLIDSYVLYVWHNKKPEKEDMQLWFDWIESMGNLYYGSIDSYLDCLNKIKAKVATRTSL